MRPSIATGFGLLLMCLPTSELVGQIRSPFQPNRRSGGSVLDPRLLPPGGQLNVPRSAFEPVPLFGGFPSFPESARRAGTLFPPAFGDPNQPAPSLGILPPRAPDAWPSWFAERVADGAAESTAKYTPRRAILIRQEDRVWVRRSGDVFVPVRFNAKYRALEAGDVVEVRQRGHFEVLFQDGARIDSFGAGRVDLVDLEEDLIEIAVPIMTRANITTEARPFRAHLPDGSILEAQRTSLLYQLRDDGLAELHNVGHFPARLRLPWARGAVGLPAAMAPLSDSGERDGPTADGSVGRLVVIPPLHGVVLFGRLPVGRDGRQIADTLSVVGDGARVAEAGRELRVDAAASGTTEADWGGARFSMKPGGKLVLDPMAGAGFPREPGARARQVAQNLDPVDPDPAGRVSPPGRDLSDILPSGSGSATGDGESAK